MSSPYRAPAPPPAEPARRMSWWERMWLRAWRRWVSWWLTPSSSPRWLDDMLHAHNASIAHLKASSPSTYYAVRRRAARRRAVNWMNHP